MFHWYCSGFWPLRPVDEISNAKLSISFARQLRRRLFFSLLSPVRISVSSYRFFISNMGLTLSIFSAGLRGQQEDNPYHNEDYQYCIVHSRFPPDFLFLFLSPEHSNEHILCF